MRTDKFSGSCIHVWRHSHAISGKKNFPIAESVSKHRMFFYHFYAVSPENKPFIAALLRIACGRRRRMTGRCEWRHRKSRWTVAVAYRRDIKTECAAAAKRPRPPSGELTKAASLHLTAPRLAIWRGSSCSTQNGRITSINCWPERGGCTSVIWPRPP